MIQVYDAFNDEYDRNGNVVLDPIECTATFSLDGNWSMHMELPITKNMSTLDDISVVAADTPYGKSRDIEFMVIQRMTRQCHWNACRFSSIPEIIF